MRLYFVRHGESENNALNIPQVPDVGLSERGSREAKALAERIAHLPVDLILSSPYKRTSETTEIINEHLQKPVEFTPLLQERRNPSEIIGMSADDPESLRIRSLILENYGKEGWRYSDEETFSDLKDRALALLQYTINLERERILLVTHGAFLLFVIATMIFGEELTPHIHKKFIVSVRNNPTGLTVSEYTPENNWRLLTWNDLAHLG